MNICLITLHRDKTTETTDYQNNKHASDDCVKGSNGTIWKSGPVLSLELEQDQEESHTTSHISKKL